MHLACLLGFHAWNGCVCSRCARQRGEGHNWHEDCEKCATCGEERADRHQWNGCVCSLCGRSRDEGHDWSRDCEKCSRCGATRARAHDWAADCERCAVCGTTRVKPHVWSADCERCRFCKATRANQHTWDRCKCSTCGKAREGDEVHDWSKDCEQCAYCGKTRKAHTWDGFRCTRCGSAISGVSEGDRVRLSEYLGCWHVTTDGVTREIHFHAGHIGTVLRPGTGSSVVVALDAQNWRENLCGGHSSGTVYLPSFESVIGVKSLERVREGVMYVGTSSYQAYHGVTHIKVELLDGGDAVMYEDGGKNGIYTPLGNKLVWRQNGSAIWIGASAEREGPFPPDGFHGKVEGDWLLGTRVSGDGKQKWDWVLRRE